MVVLLNDINSLSLKPRFKMVSWLINSLEGFKPKIYNDIAGNATIGYGHEIIGQIDGDSGIKFLNLSSKQIEQGLTQELAHQLLAHDIFHRAYIQNYFTFDLHNHAWVSLTSFCFNIGDHKFKQSDTFKFMHTNDVYQAANSLCSWREVNGKFSEGIAKRRMCETLILLEKPLNIHSPMYPSKQLGSLIEMPYVDDNWSKISEDHKRQVVEIYNSYVKNFADQ